MKNVQNRTVLSDDEQVSLSLKKQKNSNEFFENMWIMHL